MTPDPGKPEADPRPRRWQSVLGAAGCALAPFALVITFVPLALWAGADGDVVGPLAAGLLIVAAFLVAPLGGLGAHLVQVARDAREANVAAGGEGPSARDVPRAVALLARETWRPGLQLVAGLALLVALLGSAALGLAGGVLLHRRLVSGPASPATTALLLLFASVGIVAGGVAGLRAYASTFAWRFRLLARRLGGWRVSGSASQLPLRAEGVWDGLPARVVLEGSVLRCELTVPGLPAGPLELRRGSAGWRLGRSLALFGAPGPQVAGAADECSRAEAMATAVEAILERLSYDAITIRDGRIEARSPLSAWALGSGEVRRVLGCLAAAAREHAGRQVALAGRLRFGWTGTGGSELRCPWCRDALPEPSDAVACDACGTLHHAECLGEAGGCTVLGCAAGVPRRGRVR